MRTIRRRTKEWNRVLSNTVRAEFYSPCNGAGVYEYSVTRALGTLEANDKNYRLLHNGTNYVIEHKELPGTYTLYLKEA